MIGLWLQDGQLELKTDLPMLKLVENEALVRVRLAGICNTDLELLRGYYPYTGILGHEFVGVVEQAGPWQEHLVGKRVVGEINAVCSECEACIGGRERHCENRTVLGILGRHGAFAEFLTLPVDNLHVVPDSVPDEAAVFVEPLAAALEIQEQIEIDLEDQVLVVGDGKLGQLIARTLKLAGCELLVAGRHPDKLVLLAALGIETLTVDSAGAGDPHAGIRQGSFDTVVECTGNPEGFALARHAVRPRGTLVMKSTYADQLTLDAAALVVDEITLVGSRCGPFEPAIELLRSGEIYVEELISDRLPLSTALAAFERAQQPGVLKVLLDVG